MNPPCQNVSTSKIFEAAPIAQPAPLAAPRGLVADLHRQPEASAGCDPTGSAMVAGGWWWLCYVCVMCVLLVFFCLRFQWLTGSSISELAAFYWLTAGCGCRNDLKDLNITWISTLQDLGGDHPTSNHSCLGWRRCLLLVGMNGIPLINHSS